MTYFFLKAERMEPEPHVFELASHKAGAVNYLLFTTFVPATCPHPFLPPHSSLLPTYLISGLVVA